MNADRPTIVCLCGSTRNPDIFEVASLDETLSGNIVLSIGANTKEAELFASLSWKERMFLKRALDRLHFKKIEIADEVLILNAGSYIGLSTCDELFYALALNKKIRFIYRDDYYQGLLNGLA